MEFAIPDYVKKILKLLTRAGFKAYVVGGAVRDLLLGETPGDFDVTTNARPEQVTELAREAGFSVVDRLGHNFGVVVLVVDCRSVEVATFRGERYAYDAHRPSEVWYCDSLQEDLSRRDFTVNAMALDPDGNVYDYFGGRHDLERKILRTVGDPARRYAEDALRMFRACRFVAQLDFTYVEGEGDVPACESVAHADELEAKALAAINYELPSEAAEASYFYGRANKTSTAAAYVNGRAAQRHGAADGVTQPLARESWPDAGEPFGAPGTPYFLPQRYVFDTRRCAELSRERVKKEIEKLLLGKAAGRGLMLMLSTGLLRSCFKLRQEGSESYLPVLPEFEHLYGLRQNSRFHCYNTLEHTLLALDLSERSLEIRWALLLHDIGKGLQNVRQLRADGSPSDHGHEAMSAGMTPGILRRFGYAPDFIRRVTWLVAQHMRFAPMLFAKKNTVARWVRGEALSGKFRSEAELTEGYVQLANVFLSDMGATWAGVRGEAVVRDGEQLTLEAIELARTRLPVTPGDLKIRGRDVIPLLKIYAPDDGAMLMGKIAPDGGKMLVGDALRYLLRRVQTGNLPNEREALLAALEKKLERQHEARQRGAL